MGTLGVNPDPRVVHVSYMTPVMLLIQSSPVKDQLPFEKWIFPKDQPVRDVEQTMSSF